MRNDPRVPMTQPRVFAMMTGDYPNIGDALIRERVFAWARKAASAADVYVGSAPPAWMVRLGVRRSDRVYSTRQLGSFFVAILRARRPVLVVEPGELDLSARMLVRQIAYLVFAATTRAKGGAVVLPPRAVARDAFRPSVWVHRLTCRLSQHVWWRNARSVEAVGCGTLAPDVAFSEPTYWDDAVARSKLVVSMRGPRPWPGDQLLKAIRSFADESGLEIVCVPQVRQDEERARELASALGGEYLPWGDRSDVDHEAALRSLYRETAITVSDRLHVLILAALGGAVPAELAPGPAPKVREHFEAIGYRGTSMDSAMADDEQAVAFLRNAYSRSAEIRTAVQTARATLTEIEQTVLDTVTGHAAGPRRRSARERAFKRARCAR